MLHLNITFPEDLKEALDREAKREHTQRSTLIQKAVRAYLEFKKQKSLHDLMKQGYLAEASESRELTREWGAALMDGLDD